MSLLQSVILKNYFYYTKHIKIRLLNQLHKNQNYKKWWNDSIIDYRQAEISKRNTARNNYELYLLQSIILKKSAFV